VADDAWVVRPVPTASCPIGNERLILPDDVRPGDVVSCHGTRHRVTYAFGAWALERLPD